MSPSIPSNFSVAIDSRDCAREPRKIGDVFRGSAALVRDIRGQRKVEIDRAGVGPGVIGERGDDLFRALLLESGSRTKAREIGSGVGGGHRCLQNAAVESADFSGEHSFHALSAIESEHGVVAGCGTDFHARGQDRTE
jgi:hypothetical protein